MNKILNLKVLHQSIYLIIFGVLIFISSQYSEAKTKFDIIANNSGYSNLILEESGFFDIAKNMLNSQKFSIGLEGEDLSISTETKKCLFKIKNNDGKIAPNGIKCSKI